MYSDAIYSVKKLSVAQYFKMIKTFLYMRWDKKKKGTKGLVHVRYIRYINSRRKKYIYIYIYLRITLQALQHPFLSTHVYMLILYTCTPEIKLVASLIGPRFDPWKFYEKSLTDKTIFSPPAAYFQWEKEPSQKKDTLILSYRFINNGIKLSTNYVENFVHFNFSLRLFRRYL